MDKRSKRLKKLNIVDDGREFLVRSLHFRSEDYDFPGKFSYSRIFYLNYLIVKLCITRVRTCCKIKKLPQYVYNKAYNIPELITL